MSQLRVGILTYHFSDNFGALMQAYGLRRWLMSQGCEVEFINYHPTYVEGGGDLLGSIRRLNPKAFLKSAFLAVVSVKQALSGQRGHLTQFVRFQNETLGVAGPAFPDKKSVENFLSRPEGQFGMLICGSDQVWAPSPQFGIDPVYYLAFSKLNPHLRRVAYAPSFGKGSLDKQYRAEVSSYLNELDGLAARERSGVAIVEELTGRPAAWVPDPTILLGDFSELAQAGGSLVGDGHVFCYTLRSPEGIRNIATMAGKHFDGEVLSPYNPHRRWREIGRTIYPSPEGWVSFLSRSRFVVTNSFHGTVFSILFRKPFLTVGLPGKRAPLNERSKNLLSALGIEDRLVLSGDFAKAKEMFDRPIDWSSVEARLAEMQASGRNYLSEQIALANRANQSQYAGVPRG